MATALFVVVSGGCPALAQQPAAVPSSPAAQQPAPSPARRGKEKPAPPPTILPAEPAWTITLPSAPSAGGAMDASRIYVPLQDGGIAALDRQTGEMIWQDDVQATWALIARAGALYAAAGNHLRALDAATGTTKWEVALDRDLMGPPRFEGGLLIVLMAPDEVRAYDAADGQLRWKQALGGRAGAFQMIAGAEAVVVTAPRGRLVALSLVDGHQLWERTVPGTLSEPATAHDRVFIGSTDNYFYAFDGRSGHFEWKWRAGGDVVGATADKDVVYFASLDNILRAVNRGNGNQRWQKDTGTRPTGPPAIVGPVVVVPGVSATISAFSVLTGAPVGTFTPLGAVELQGAPMLDPALLPFQVAAVILTRDGRVIALRPTGMMFREAPPAPFMQLPGRVLDPERPPAGTFQIPSDSK